ncbi:bifunctional DNA primase/polymerase [Streptomyces varsoviensis]|uniref:bifunctional DNA primase/polymerase n=1 Tax=Streptomyces varsoviensis TaxID=67373 RepID=UPI0033EFF778
MSTWSSEPTPVRPIRSQAAGRPHWSQRRRQPRQARHTAAYVTLAGADWLASASPFPRSVHALWAADPAASVVLPCGTAFDVVSVPALFGRRLADQLWSNGPGSGPVATQRGRILLFASVGTAQRLPALLDWEEWRALVPPPLCHGKGDEVAVPPTLPVDLLDSPEADTKPGPPSRWLVAPDLRHPWLPGPEVLLWGCIRAARTGLTVPADTPATSQHALSPS